MIKDLKRLWTRFQNHQNRVVVWGVKFGCLFLVFFIFYLPAKNHQANLSRDLEQRKKDTASAKQNGVDQLQPRELEEAEKTAKEFESALMDVSQAASVMNIVSDEASKHNFSIATINSENLIPVKNEAGIEIERQGKKLKRIPIHIQFETNVKNTAGFLRSLAESSKHLWVVDSLSLQKTSPQSENLKCEITLSFFAY